MNGTVHLFCLFPCRVDQYFPRTVSSNGEDREEGRKKRMKRFCDIVARLGNDLIPRLGTFLNQGDAAVVLIFYKNRHWEGACYL